MSRTVRMLLASALGALGLGAMAGPAQAGIWTEIPSGTTEEITAIEYRGGDQFWYTTGSGKIFQRIGGTFQQRYSAPGVVFRDIEFNAAGTIGVAVGTNGHYARSSNGGATWGPIVLPNSRSSTSELDCGTTMAPGDLDSVRTDGLGRAWVAGTGAQIWRSTGTGAAFGQNLQDANDGAGTACALVARDIDAMVFVPGVAGGYFIAKSFGQVFFSSDPFTTSGAEKAGRAGNGFTQVRRAVGDPANTNRMWAVVPAGDGGSYVRRTIDGWSSEEDWTIANPDTRGFSRAFDVDYAGGTVLAAGAAGMVLQSVNGEHFFYNDAEGGIATQDWRAVSVASGASAAIGGTNGKLAVTTQANVTPDIVKPTGTISGPTSVIAGRSATFTLNAADTGGSGLNPASYSWTSAGLPTQGGQTVSYTFPSEGFYTLRVRFADRAGNTAEATLAVSVSRATSLRPTFSLTGPGNSASARIIGRFVRIRARGTIRPPAGVPVAAACVGKVNITVKRKKTTIAKTKAKLRVKNGKCRFSKTLFVKRKKVKNVPRLRLKVRFPGNAALAAGSITKTLVVKR